MWQPIETAPKDEWILLCIRGFIPAVGRWQADRGVFDWVDADTMPDNRSWEAYLDSNPEWPVTHWMPLPDPPQ